MFLTGEDDISAAISAITARSRLLPADVDQILPLPLYAALPPAAQAEALAPAPGGFRKAVLATNIAETSLTIEGVVYVVDSGLHKCKAYHAARRIDSLLVAPISQAAAHQRTGRAGRVRAGRCYRLYTEDTFYELQETTTPEVLRRSLCSVVLSLLSLGVQNVLAFDFVTPPPLDALAAALEELLALGALDSTGALTDNGRVMAKLPVEPMYAKAILVAGSGANHEAAADCVVGAGGYTSGPASSVQPGGELMLGHMLALVSMLCADGALFHAPANKKDAADEARNRFRSPHGDTITSLAVFAAYENTCISGIAPDAKRRKATSANSNVSSALPLPVRERREGRRWCESNFVNWRTMETAVLIRAQLLSACQRLGIGYRVGEDGEARMSDVVHTIGAEESVALRRCLTAACFLQAAIRTPTGDYVTLVSRQTVAIHPSSVLFSKKSQCVLFNELVFTSRLYMRELTHISQDWLAELAPHFFAAAAAGAHAMVPGTAAARMKQHPMRFHGNTSSATRSSFR